MRQQEKANYPVACLRRVMAVSTSGYYAWLARAPSQREERDRELTRKIQVIHKAQQRRFGSPRMHTDLRAQGERVGKKRVERLTGQRGLQGQRLREYNCTTNSKHTKKVAPNLLQQHFEADQPDRAFPPISRSSRRQRAGCTAPSCWTCLPARWSAGPYRHESRVIWCSTRSTWPRVGGCRRRGSFSSPTAEVNTRRTTRPG